MSGLCFSLRYNRCKVLFLVYYIMLYISYCCFGVRVCYIYVHIGFLFVFIFFILLRGGVY